MIQGPKRVECRSQPSRFKRFETDLFRRLVFALTLVECAQDALVFSGLLGQSVAGDTPGTGGT